MTRVIHKAILDLRYVQGAQEIVVHGENVKILSVQFQGNAIAVWYEVDVWDIPFDIKNVDWSNKAAIATRLIFYIAFTGDEVPLGYDYIGTVVYNTATVLHIYKR